VVKETLVALEETTHLPFTLAAGAAALERREHRAHLLGLRHLGARD
jgi:hypothetical protein